MCCHIVRCASFKFERQVSESGFLKGNSAYHFSASLIWRHLFEEFFFSIEHADTCGTVHLMPREGKEVTIQFLYVNLYMRSTLRPVHHTRNAVFVGDSDNILNGVYCSEDIADMGNADQLCAVSNEIFHSGNIQYTVIRHWYDLHDDAVFLRLQLPRNDVAVMLHGCDEHFVTGFHVCLDKTGSNKVYGFCGATGKNNFRRAAGINELANGLPCLLVQVCSLLRQIVHTTVYVGVDIKIFFPHGIKHTQRFLCSCTIVEIYEGIFVVNFSR